ncbi:MULTISPECIES: hypothetical protein [unclassified Pseudofrankia]|uniref:hypothetical protein n=1 Tax=unclassified Pseudofrankia TaxID=2994372 RepID=UPI0009231D4B|nr:MULTISPECIES: hypothetical protein [unclassified Pseudofrankia]MDT3443650.1 hypothetical protein [Pseudofrankia sp. BMG5.37]OHV42944.1 hypothetical protein BCD48_29610 [Pseudofrankia sp. BMG5.36]
MAGLPDGGAVPHHAELVAAGRALTASADYGSLALWGGRVAHGLRFTSRRLDGMLIPSAPTKQTVTDTDAGSMDRQEDPSAAGHAADGQPAVDSSHRDTSARDLPPDDLPPDEQPTAGPAAGEYATGVEQIADLHADWPTGAVHRLLMLAPGAIGQLLGADDHACRFQFCGLGGPVTEQARWVSVAFGGWVAAVPVADAATLTSHFAERHPTGDLFDLGGQWAMLEIDVVEAFIRTAHGGVRLDTDDARSMLAP